MSRKKRICLISSLVALVAGFTAWNFYDFCASEHHSTAGYLAIIFNFGAIAELFRLIRKELNQNAND